MRDGEPLNVCLGRPVLAILLGGLMLALIAWGVAELYRERAKTHATEQGSQAAPSPGPASGSSDTLNSKIDTMNAVPVDKNPKVDKNPTPQSSTGGDQQGTQPAQPSTPYRRGRALGRRSDFDGPLCPGMSKQTRI